MSFTFKPRTLRLRQWPQDAVERQAYVDPIFSTIASRYDFMTRALSFGQEQRWKREAVRLVPKDRAIERILDLASGTGDFPLHLTEASFNGGIVSLDRNASMLAFAREKCAGRMQVNFVQGDLRDIPFKDHSFDLVTLGYGLRYPHDVRQILKEVFRLLRSGGTFVCLDFGVPRNRLFRRLCFGYLILMGSFWGYLLHGKINSYWHIVESLRAYPGQRAVRMWLEEISFVRVKLRERLGGLIAMLSATRP